MPRLGPLSPAGRFPPPAFLGKWCLPAGLLSPVALDCPRAASGPPAYGGLLFLRSTPRLPPCGIGVFPWSLISPLGSRLWPRPFVGGASPGGLKSPRGSLIFKKRLVGSGASLAAYYPGPLALFSWPCRRLVLAPGPITPRLASRLPRPVSRPGVPPPRCPICGWRLNPRPLHARWSSLGPIIACWSLFPPGFALAGGASPGGLFLGGVSDPQPTPGSPDWCFPYGGLLSRLGLFFPGPGARWCLPLLLFPPVLGVSLHRRPP